MTKIMTVGFLFDSEMHAVLLVRKTHPEWQKGKWNGIGGHVEPGETPAECMAREFQEETGLLDPLSWCHYHQLEEVGVDDVFVHFYWATARNIVLTHLGDRRNDVGEELMVWSSNMAACPQAISNLRWLVPLAVDSAQHQGYWISSRSTYIPKVRDGR